MTSADFPLPTLGPLLGHLLAEVTNGRGFALVKGLPVQRWTRVQVGEDTACLCPFYSRARGLTPSATHFNTSETRGKGRSLVSLVVAVSSDKMGA